MTKWMDIAWAEVGTAEISGPAANPRVLEYFAAAGHPEIASDETAWCAAFGGYCLSKAGVSLDAVPHDLRLRARAYLKLGTPIDEPRVGAIAILARHVDGDAGAAHFTFVAGVTDTHIVGLGGNQSNTVNQTQFPKSSVIGYRWPVVVTARDLDASGSRISRASRQIRNDSAGTGTAETLRNTLPPEMPGLGKIANQATEAMSAFEQLQAFAGFAYGKLPLLLLAATAFFVVRIGWNALAIRSWRAEDASTGAHTGRATTEEADV